MKIFRDVQIGETFKFKIWTGEMWEFIKTGKHIAHHNVENHAGNFSFDWDDVVE